MWGKNGGKSRKIAQNREECLHNVCTFAAQKTYKNMVTTNFYLDDRRGEAPYQLTLRLTYMRTTAYIRLGIKLTPEQWDGVKVVKHPRAGMLNNQLMARKAEIDCRLYDLERGGKIKGKKASDIKAFIEAEERGEEVKDGMSVAEHIELYMSFKTGRTKGLYEETRKKIEKYGMPERYEEITVDWLRQWELWLGGSVNGRAIHLRNLRALMNDAIDRDITTHYPFRKFKIKKEETRKRSLTLEQLHTLRDWEVEEYQEQYRDIFILMILMRGINIGDLALLTEENVVDGRIDYRRQKTKEFYSIKIEPEMMDIINRYKGEKFLLNIGDRYNDYTDYMRRMNKGLRNIGELKVAKCKKIIKPLFPDITTYWARHSFATVAMYDCGLSMDMIADLLGHKHGLDITSIYIKKNEKAMDKAARKVIDKVMYGK